MKRDKTFVMIGVELFVMMLIVAIVFAKTVIQWLAFIGTLILLEIMCYLAHLSVNDNNSQKDEVFQNKK